MTDRRIHTGFLIVTVLCIAAHARYDGAPRGILMTGLGLVAMLSIAVGLRINRVADRLPWFLVIGSLAMLTVVNAGWLLDRDLGWLPGAVGPVTTLATAGGYFCLLSASVIIVLRRAAGRSGDVIDAALIGAGIAGPIWEFILRPVLLAKEVPVDGQLIVLIQLLTLLATLGSVLQVTLTTSRSRPVLAYLLAALSATLVGRVLWVLTMDWATGESPNWVGAFWVLGYIGLAAAGLHPGVAQLSKPDDVAHEKVSGIRLVFLGVILSLNPILGAIPQLFGRAPDGLLLCVGQLVVIPLVLTRVGQLIAQRTRDQQALEHRAAHDELTGLPNRRQVFALVERELNGPGAADIAILYCDLDRFKPINDELGHEAGDHVLRVVGERLLRSVRRGGVVGRIGGDEFLIVCPRTDPVEVERLRHRIEKAVAAPIDWRGNAISVGVTVGAATLPGERDVHEHRETTADALIAIADQAMYSRKRARGAAREAATAA